ncbi:unnamed protein product [Closterium sp. Naga37s-1]|nr:unnamed protein product [Closterium sp. Naga37s-1]
MVIAGAPEPSPERVAAWSAVVAKPPSVPETGTMATKPPVPPAPRPSTTVSEKLLLPERAVPSAAGGSGPAAQVLAQAVPSAAPVPVAPPVLREDPQASGLGGDLGVSPVPAPGSVAPPVAAPAVSVHAHGVVVAPPAAVPGAPAPAPGLPVPPTAAVPDTPAPFPGVPFAPPAVVHGAPAPASASSLQAASATTGGPAPLLAPSSVGHPASEALPVAQTGQPARQSRPHSPASHQERRSSRRRRDSPRRYQQQSHWPAHLGGQGDRRGPRGRGGGYRPPVTMADLHREVSRAVHEERAAQSGGSGGGQYPPSAAVEEPFQFLAEALQPPQTRVPEATLGQLHRLAESLHALLLIQVLAHSSLPAIPPETLRRRQRETCLDAVDQLSVMLAPVLAAPAEGGAAAAG